MSTSRDRILERVKATASVSSHPEPALPSRFDDSNLWVAFETYLVALGGRIISRDELELTLAKRCFVEPAAATILGIEAVADEIWDVEIGVSLAEFAIAETGTLVVTAGEGRARMSSLAPPINVVLVSKCSIVGTLDQAISRIPSTTSVLITGPSRTADIEGILVRGVHGPGELLVYIYE
ncbi:MAG: lactate utilization protein [Armatimonadota bacterium]